MKLDAITTEVIVSRLRETTEAMAHTLFHSGYSPILRESQDGTAGLTDHQGKVIMLGGGLQYHSILYTKSVQSILAVYPQKNLKEGDSFVCNDPYQAGNSHVPDMVVATPIFFKSKLIAFGVSVAHKADVGGLVPGSSGAGAREIFHDGLRLPPVRYSTKRGIIKEIEDIIRTNSRVPEMVVGDLRGQVGATRIGAERLKILCNEYGVDLITQSMESLIERTKKRVIKKISGWKDGESEAEGFLDNDGCDLEKPVKIHVKITKKGTQLTIDFSGSNAQTSGPVNTPGQTCRAVSLLGVLASLDPTIPVNAGSFSAIDFVLPEGKVVNPVYPATVNHYFPTSHLAYAVVVAALGKLNPERAVAPPGLGNGAMAIGYKTGRNGKPAVQYEIMVTALGGTSKNDGTSMVLGMCHFTPSTPIEIIETEYPIRIPKFDIWLNSAGPGKQRGGIGFIREYEMLDDVSLTVRTANHQIPGWGLAGGQAPPVCRTTIISKNSNSMDLPALDSRQLKKGSRISLQQTGGSGYGNPKGRASELVVEDVRNGYVSIAAAEEKYGVVIRKGNLDEKATKSKRKNLI